MVAAGASGAGSIAEAVAGADVVITMLPDAPDVERAALGAGGILEHIGQDAIYVDMSTIDPATTRRVGERFAARGVRMIDAPVTRSVAQAITGNLALLIGGEVATFEAVRPVLACMADTMTHCGALGNGAAMKLVNNFMSAGIVALMSEAMSMGVKAGLTLELMIDASSKTGTRNFMLQEYLPAHAFVGNFAGRLLFPPVAEGPAPRAVDGGRLRGRGAGRPDGARAVAADRRAIPDRRLLQPRPASARSRRASSSGWAGQR